MITARPILVAVVLTIVAMAARPSVASQLGDEGASRILIANPSSALRAYLPGGGFTMESMERLEALDLSLMIVSPPPHVSASAAIDGLQREFPVAIIGLNDWFYPARDARLRHGYVAQARQILAAINWQSDAHGANAGIRVGVIDGSIDLAHPAIKGAAIVQRRFTSGKPPATDAAHGTAIAAMLVGRSNDRSLSGLLRGATLLHAGIFQDSRQGPKASSADFLRAMNWLVKSGVKVINASITSPSKNPVVLYAMSMLAHHDAMVIAAAGNGGPSGPPVYPAAIESVFAVTAVSMNGDVYRYANAGDYIDISAPGIDVPTTSSRITSGTSLAVPFVTAAVARTVQMCGMSPRAAQLRLQAYARDLGTRGWDSHFGWGMLQASGCDPEAKQLSSTGVPLPAD